ncbi:MAG TPA: hypothetical protein VJQ09_00585, partial [Candidatus Limnocylindria bacterium]|nr:hypothetical protein [Candidatus Limnocylindria bacterium]
MRALAMLVAVTMACGPSTAPSATPSPVAVTAAIATAARTATAPPTTAPVSPTASPAPTPTPLDARTAALVARLKEWCGDPRGSITQVFEVIGRLADGRSANELVSVLGGPSCVLRSFAAGDGATEWVTISAYRDTGALLWVDRGFWRIAPVPSEGGYLWPSGDRSVGPRRELLMAIDGGGSGGAMGVLVVEIADAGARVALDTGRTGVSHLGASFVDDELLLVSGRKLPDRPWGIAANCCLPGGHEWLWRRTASGYVLVGERQDQSPYYALNALLGAIDANAPDLANDVAT